MLRDRASGDNPYHHRANSTERCNRTLKSIINMFIDGNHKEWDVHIYEFYNAVNTSVHASTKVTLAYLNFGRHSLPHSSLRREVEQGREIESTTVKWGKKM